jgi:hypothetical protein
MAQYRATIVTENNERRKKKSKMSYQKLAHRMAAKYRGSEKWRNNNEKQASMAS